MATYSEEKRRRIEQFTQLLQLMRARRNKIAKDDCFAIFDEAAPEGADSSKIKRSAAIKHDCRTNGGMGSGGDTSGLLTHKNPRQSRSRYFQFAFMRDCFYLDLPNNTVFPHEAEQILRHRLGFYRALNRADFRWVRRNWKATLTWDPLQKVYLYRDEESAAEDVAFILFQVWHFPVDSPLYIKAAAFNTPHRFEYGKRFD